MYYSRYDIVWNTSDIKFVLYRQDNFLYYQIRIVQVGYIFILSNSYCTGEIHFLYYQIRIVQVGYIFIYQIRIAEVGYIFILSNLYCTGGIHFHIIKFVLYRWDTFSILSNSYCTARIIFHIIKFVLYRWDTFSYYQIHIAQVGYIFILSNSYCTGGIHFLDYGASCRWSLGNICSFFLRRLRTHIGRVV